MEKVSSRCSDRIAFVLDSLIHATNQSMAICQEQAHANACVPVPVHGRSSEIAMAKMLARKTPQVHFSEADWPMNTTTEQSRIRRTHSHTSHM